MQNFDLNLYKKKKMEKGKSKSIEILLLSISQYLQLYGVKSLFQNKLFPNFHYQKVFILSDVTVQLLSSAVSYLLKDLTNP